MIIQYILDGRPKWTFPTSLGVPKVGWTIRVYSDRYQIVSTEMGWLEHLGLRVAKIFLERR